MLSPPEDLLDPRHYERVRRPPLEATTLPAWCYTSPEWYRLELERIFMRAWNLVGRGDRVPAPGDYVTLEYVGIPVIVVRGKDGVARAFANTCRHRGSMLLEGAGNCRAIKCPYHGWTYGLDGRLAGAPDMKESRGFRREDYGLVPVRLETWAGFMFLSFDPAGPSLAEWLGELPERVAPYSPQDLVTTRRKEYELRCNWKLYVENFKDMSHTREVHGTTLWPMQERFAAPAAFERGRGEWLAGFVQHQGSRAILGGVGGAGAGAGAKGFPTIASLRGHDREGSYYPTVFPLACFGFCNDSAWFLEMYPLGPDRMRLVVASCFHKETVARPDFEALAPLYYRRMDIAVPEDNAANENTQRGLASPHALPGRMGRLEEAVSLLNRWWLERTIGAGDG